MKRQAIVPGCVFTLVMVCCFTQCTKKDAGATDPANATIHQPTGVNRILYNKPVDTIDFYIRGKWRLRYQFGGLCGSCKYDREQYNEYYEFLPNSRARYTYQNILKADTTYTWTTYQSSPQDYVHHIISGPFQFEVEKIVNDTLVLAEPSRFNPEYMLYYLTKSE